MGNFFLDEEGTKAIILVMREKWKYKMRVFIHNKYECVSFIFKLTVESLFSVSVTRVLRVSPQLTIRVVELTLLTKLLFMCVCEYRYSLLTFIKSQSVIFLQFNIIGVCVCVCERVRIFKKETRNCTYIP